MRNAVATVGVVTIALLLSSCCGAADASAGTTPAVPPSNSGGVTNAGGGPVGGPVPMPPPPAAAGFDREHPVLRCGPVESYVYVASEFRCADGTNPLGGDPRAGAAARVGNVGPNSTGHIIDLYRIPCPEGAHEVYVDMYGCPPGRSPF